VREDLVSRFIDHWHFRSLGLKDKLLRNLLQLLIEKFGLWKINDTIAQILFEQAHDNQKFEWDDLSEMYEAINQKLSTIQNK